MLLLLFRRFSRWQFKRSTAEELSANYQPHQFGIKHILILTTIAALACGLVRTLLIMNPSLKWLPSIAEYLGILCVILALLFPVLIIPWYTLAYRGRIAALILFTAIIAGICDLSVYFMAIATIPSPVTDKYEQIIKPFFLVQFGAALSVLFSTLVMRWCGFRMIRVRKMAS